MYNALEKSENREAENIDSKYSFIHLFIYSSRLMGKNRLKCREKEQNQKGAVVEY